MSRYFRYGRHYAAHAQRKSAAPRPAQPGDAGLRAVYRDSRGQAAEESSASALVPFIHPSAEGSGTFAWIPRYPGATTLNIRTHETEKELTYGLEFTSHDDPDAITSYIERDLRGAGFKTKTNRASLTETNLHGEAVNPTRTIDIGIDKVQNGTYVTVAAAQQ